jgi:hypothetical protein
MKRIYLSERDAHTFEQAAQFNVLTVPIVSEPFPPAQRTVEYVNVRDVQPLIQALKDAASFVVFDSPGAAKHWRKTIKDFESRTYG